MRKLVAQLIVLTFACNGIACACPQSSDGTAESPHHAHQTQSEAAHVEPQADREADCCTNCDELSAAERDSRNDIALPLKTGDEFDIEVIAVAATNFCCLQRILSRSSPTIETTHHVATTTVEFFDRMHE